MCKFIEEDNARKKKLMIREGYVRRLQDEAEKGVDVIRPGFAIEKIMTAQVDPEW